LLRSKEWATFLGPVRNGLSHRHVVAAGNSVIAASARSAAASSLPRSRKIGGGAPAEAFATPVFWAFALFAGVCSVRRVVASRSSSQHKLGRCTVACRAAELPTPVLFQPCASVVEELKPTPTTTAPPPLPAPPAITAQIIEPRNAVSCATMVGGARCTTTARSIARRARQRSTAHRATKSRATRRAVGSRLQAASCLQEVPPLTFDASRQRLKIQAGLRLANRVLAGRMNGIRLPAGSSGKLNGRFSSVLYVIRDFTDSKNLPCATVCKVASDFATRWPTPMHY